MGPVAQARPEIGRILYRDQRRIAQPDAAGLLQVVAYQRRTDAATGGATGHGQIMQVQTIGFTVTVEFTVQRRDLAQPRRVGEQVAADLGVLGYPGQLRAGRRASGSPLRLPVPRQHRILPDRQDGRDIALLHRSQLVHHDYTRMPRNATRPGKTGDHTRNGGVLLASGRPAGGCTGPRSAGVNWPAGSSPWQHQSAD